MKKQSFIGKVVYKTTEGGFWGIVDESGNEYLPINMPEQLKLEGRTIEVTVKPVEDYISMFMWGTPVKITAFHTFTP